MRSLAPLFGDRREDEIAPGNGEVEQSQSAGDVNRDVDAAVAVPALSTRTSMRREARIVRQNVARPMIPTGIERAHSKLRHAAGSISLVATCSLLCRIYIGQNPLIARRTCGWPVQKPSMTRSRQRRSPRRQSGHTGTQERPGEAGRGRRKGVRRVEMVLRRSPAEALGVRGCHRRLQERSEAERCGLRGRGLRAKSGLGRTGSICMAPARSGACGKLAPVPRDPFEFPYAGKLPIDGEHRI